MDRSFMIIGYWIEMGSFGISLGEPLFVTKRGPGTLLLLKSWHA